MSVRFTQIYRKNSNFLLGFFILRIIFSNFYYYRVKTIHSVRITQAGVTITVLFLVDFHYLTLISYVIAPQETDTKITRVNWNLKPQYNLTTVTTSFFYLIFIKIENTRTFCTFHINGPTFCRYKNNVFIRPLLSYC